MYVYVQQDFSTLDDMSKVVRHLDGAVFSLSAGALESKEIYTQLSSWLSTYCQTYRRYVCRVTKQSASFQGPFLFCRIDTSFLRSLGPGDSAKRGSDACCIHVRPHTLEAGLQHQERRQ